jgi:hypothetical protein
VNPVGRAKGEAFDASVEPAAAWLYLLSTDRRGRESVGCPSIISVIVPSETVLTLKRHSWPPGKHGY